MFIVNRDVVRNVNSQISEQARELNNIEQTRDVNAKKTLIKSLMDKNRNTKLRQEYERYRAMKMGLWTENPISLLYPNSDSMSYFSFFPLHSWTADGIFEWIVVNLNNITRMCWLVAGVMYVMTTEPNAPMYNNTYLMAALFVPVVLACLAKSAIIKQDVAFEKAIKPLNVQFQLLQREHEKAVDVQTIIKSKPPPSVETIVDPSSKDVIVSTTDKYYAGQRSFKPMMSTKTIIQNSILGKRERLAQYTGSFSRPANETQITWPKFVRTGSQ